MDCEGEATADLHSWDTSSESGIYSQFWSTEAHSRKGTGGVADSDGHSSQGMFITTYFQIVSGTYNVFKDAVVVGKCALDLSFRIHNHVFTLDV
jgi:hypothetical protein